VAVEVHKFNAMETDLRFDMGMKLLVDAKPFTPNTTYVNCDPNSTNTIGCFTSVPPTAQTELFVYPTTTHTFQLFVKSTETKYTSGATGTIPNGNDFTGYVPYMGSSKNGSVAINHENGTGAVTMVGTHFNVETMLWEVDSVHNVDFSEVVKTERNCSGGVTPWGTTITSEETYSTADVDGDGYVDVGWNVEMDPKTGKIMDYDGDGKPDKLWAIGRMSHENIAIGNDGVTVYQAEDGGTNCVYKYIANKKGNLSEGNLFVLKRDSSTATTGTWIQVPNTTKSDRNNTRTLAGSLGGTNWSGAEDIEFGTDGMMYFTAKGTGTIWRFKDDGTKVSKIEAWVTNKAYTINHTNGTTNENFGTGIDNLAFDNEGNLWAQQDGGRNHIWVIRPDHTPAKPHVELFATIPAGAESTGLTFTPDFKYGFFSFQNPSTTNTQTQKDAAGKEVKHNQSTTVVFSRKQFLGSDAVAPVFDLGQNITSCEGQTVMLKAYSKNDAIVKWNNNSNDSVLAVTKAGTYYATAYGNNGKTYTDSVTVSFAKTPVANLGTDKKQCGGSVTLDAGNTGMQYLWSTGAKTKTLVVTKSGQYVVSVVNSAAGCVSKDTINVTIFTEPIIDLGPNMAICNTCSVILNAGSGFSSYLWSDGSTGQFLKVDSTGRYSVKVTDANGCTAVDFMDVTRLVGIEDANALEGMVQVYPNPFQKSTNIKLTLPENAQVKMEIFDITGKKIETLADSKFTRGDYQFEFNPKGSAKGIYMLQLQIDNSVVTKKLIRLND
ncbi:MAG: alkaline phosphatase PhoX, partial [Bacteroidia bacterium]